MEQWQEFFDAYAPKYDQEVFTKNTDAEVDFIVTQLQPPDDAHILDVGCGTGRHSVGLARLGYKVTGLDVSAAMLRVAQQRAADAGVAVEWVHADAGRFTRPDTFDLVICLCEGAMCLLGTADDPLDHDLIILRNIHQSLRAGGRFLLNVLNACRMIRRHSDDDVTSGRFDILNLTEATDISTLLPDSDTACQLRERGYTPPELRRMLAGVGFEVQGIFGGTAGDWALRPPRLDEFELMALARKAYGTTCE